MIAEKDPYIKSAYGQLQVISQDKQKRMEYEAREKAIRDYNQGIYEAEQRGELRGEQRASELYSCLVKDKRYTDVERATKDLAFRTQLMKEYGI